MATQTTSVLLITEMQFQAQDIARHATAPGLTVTTALDEPSAQQLLCRKSFHVVLLDADLGYGTVRELAAAIRAQHPETKLGGLVGWWDERETEMRDICDVVLNKPVDPAQLRSFLGRTAVAENPGRAIQHPEFLASA